MARKTETMSAAETRCCDAYDALVAAKNEHRALRLSRELDRSSTVTEEQVSAAAARVAAAQAEMDAAEAAYRS
jgi:hypothetical protein